jgi:diguanylate cyclase
MSDADWKQKYFAAIRSIDEDERRAREIERALRRVVTRLCIVARGQDDELDTGLTQLSNANRDNASAEDLTELVGRLRDSLLSAGSKMSDNKTSVVRSLGVGRTVVAPALADVSANTLPVQRWAASCEAAALLLKQLSRDENARDFADTLTAELRAVATDEDLAKILTKIADALLKRGEELAREKTQANSLLTEMTARLDEVSDFLTTQNDERQSALGDADQLSSQVIQNVEHINREVHETNDLTEIRIKVGVRLTKITEQAREFRARQENRFLEQSALAQKMAARVASLERQTSELHRSLHQEQTRSQLDALTGVPNRGALDSRMAEEINRWKRFRDPVTVLVWDLDRFKSINDTYGHRAGDRVLQEVAKCLAARIRATDVLARFGGEEFVMLLVGTQMAEASKVANELRESVHGLRFHFRDTPVKVTTSCGMTELRDGDTAETVFDRADAALYKAKDGGRNLCVAA